MAELVPILGGLVAGFVIGQRAETARSRLILMAVASVLVGVFAGLISGELAESPAFLAIDVPGTFLAAAVAIFTLDRFGARGARERPRT